jgi:hypothetical protein
VRARLDGFAFWTPGHRDVRAWLDGAAAAHDAVHPDASLLPSRLRRRTALLTQMVCEVIGRAAAQGGVDLARAPIVLGSGWGEFETTVQLLPQLVAPRPEVSPTLFHNSVYNTAPGYLSIVHHSHAPSTAVGAGRDTLVAALIEALSMIDTPSAAPGEVLVVVADERTPAPFQRADDDSLAVGMCLRHVEHPASGGLRMRVQLARGDAPDEDAAHTRAEPFERVAANPCAAVVGLALAVASGGAARVALQGSGPGWTLSLQPGAPA